MVGVWACLFWGHCSGLSCCLPGGACADGVLWALRFAQALALAWPLHLTAALRSAGRGGGDEERTAARQELGKSQIMWKVKHSPWANSLSAWTPLYVMLCGQTASILKSQLCGTASFA